MNWRAESTGDRCPCRARRHSWLKSWQKSIGHADFGCPQKDWTRVRERRDWDGGMLSEA
jgi:hypothetical protein